MVDATNLSRACEPLPGASDKIIEDKKSWETIITEIFNADSRLQFDMKMHMINTRGDVRSDQVRGTAAKVSVLQRKTSMTWEAFGFASTLAGVFVSSEAIRTGLQGLSQVLNQMGSFQERNNQSETTQLDASSQRYEHLQNDYTQEAQRSGQAHEQSHAFLTQLRQNMQQLVMSLLRNDG